MPASTTDTITQGYGSIHKGRSTVRANLINHTVSSSHKNQPTPLTLRHHSSSLRIPQARLTSKSRLDDWEQTVLRYGRATRDRPAGVLLVDLTADLVELK